MNLRDQTLRVRFAPSPTGYLHVGGARTALFNYLLARGRGGTFLLRIEDTDRERSSDSHTRAILDGLEWLELDFDEEVTFQGDGAERHRQAATGLLEAGRAYRCFCTPEELAERREAARQSGEGFGYDGRCRGLSREASAERAAAGEAFAIRFGVPPGEVGWEDLVHGPLLVDADHLDDFVILRSDRSPVYNLAVVSDDAHSRISHVIRGDDHISNTPKQILLYEALGLDLPRFGHVPLILGPDGKRLSKRHGAMAVTAYREQGFLPDAMVNFLALLGWSLGDDRERFDRAGLIEAFSLDRVQKKSAVFDLEKLEWLNGQHIAHMPADRLASYIRPLLEPRPMSRGSIDEERLHRVIDLVKQRPRTLPLLAAQVVPFFEDEVGYEPEAVARFWKRPAEVAGLLRQLAPRLEALGSWDEEALEREIRGLAQQLDVGAGKLINPLRLALMGQGVSPGIFEVLELMGRSRTRDRIDAALGFLDAAAAAASDPARRR